VLRRIHFDFRWTVFLVVVAVIASAPAIAAGIARYAKNSGKLDGLSASDLVRATSAVNEGHLSDFRSKGFTNIQKLRFSAPVKGVIVLWSGVNAEWDDDSDPGSYADFVTRLTVDRKAVGVPKRAEIERSTKSGTLSVSVSAAVPVKAGPHQIHLQARTASGEALTYLRGRHTELMFVPFGRSGRQGSIN